MGILTIFVMHPSVNIIYTESRVSFAGNVIVLSLSMCSFRLAAKGEDGKQFKIIYPSVFNVKLYCLISS
jgi:hypothetical protein